MISQGGVKLNRINMPILYQGGRKKKKYFEGWYFKQTSGDERTIISFIPGISLFEGDLHGFIQYILVTIDDNDKKTTRTGYVRYDIDSFFNHDKPFSILVGQSTFSERDLYINIKDNGFNIEGKLKLGPLLPIKTSLLMPNIMGPFAYLPVMECYHGIVSMNHTVDGNLVIAGRDVDFKGGKGYIEKDWGTSFPSKYVWIHSNHFRCKDTSLFLSIAHIPFMKSSFTGFISNLVMEGREYRFATYNRSKLTVNKITPQDVLIELHNSNAKLTVEAYIKNPGELVAPVMGHMSKTIKEELCGEVLLRLDDHTNGMFYEDFGRLAGIEVVGL